MNASFLDTNMVVYCFSDDDDKRLKALAILATKPVISAQVLNECANVLKRKLNFKLEEIIVVIERLIQECHVVPLTAETTLLALSIVERYGFSIYDSLIIAAALSANCTTLFSEDMQHQQVIDGKLTIINPFK
ncbi:PIN domain-containing protein [Methyloglobulus sp.]|uniref:PIN domain-containing protein n=1 Tax=Methyloglobulus sp. TaxID=2518622 RepID=UPI0032B82311